MAVDAESKIGLMDTNTLALILHDKRRTCDYSLRQFRRSKIVLPSNLPMLSRLVHAYRISVETRHCMCLGSTNAVVMYCIATIQWLP